MPWSSRETISRASDFERICSSTVSSRLVDSKLTIAPEGVGSVCNARQAPTMVRAHT
jgi:hypothetical protein